ncbi:Uncharacterised protein [Candidatus Tiddalikarchaeum anstoanum]|nr:Uncharacterised protein [Candidatus Tiddalikarchaeum anstoanum]
MAKTDIKEDVINEVEDLITTNKEKTEEKTESRIIFDGRQYTLKIPKKIADAVNINATKDTFIFEIKTYPIEESKKPELIIKLKRGEQ